MFASLQASVWAYPVLEVLHLLGVALLLGNLVLLELRAFGWGAVLPLAPLARLSLMVAMAGFGLAAVSGLLMFSTQPSELLANRAFTLKMLLLSLAACNAGWFHGRGSLQRLDTLARAQLLVSTLLWLGVLTCGRWIAYL
ncbi:MAG: hypothetical protein ACK5RC_03780 [Curvibacter sp.]|nr:hypothetical protein [Curvibacter sp.]